MILKLRFIKSKIVIIIGDQINTLSVSKDIINNDLLSEIFDKSN